jgi:COMPASS component SWD3
VLVSV